MIILLGVILSFLGFCVSYRVHNICKATNSNQNWTSKLESNLAHIDRLAMIIVVLGTLTMIYGVTL